MFRSGYLCIAVALALGITVTCSTTALGNDLNLSALTSWPGPPAPMPNYSAAIIPPSSPYAWPAPSGDNTYNSYIGNLSMPHDNGPIDSRVFYSVLDLGNNDLVLNSLVTKPGDTLSQMDQLKAMIYSGYGGGVAPLSGYIHAGITSSYAYTVDPLNAGLAQLTYTTPSLYTAATGNTEYPGGPVIIGQPGSGPIPLTNAFAIVKFSWQGDFNADGYVDNVDYGLLLGGYDTYNASPGAHWFDGDMNFDGYVDNIDYGLFVGAYGQVVPGHGEVVQIYGLPEPQTWTLLLTGLVAACGYVFSRRWRVAR